MRQSRRYRGRLSTIVWYGVLVGPDRPKSLLLPDLRLAYIVRAAAGQASYGFHADSRDCILLEMAKYFVHNNSFTLF